MTFSPTFLARGRDVLYHISVSFANFLVGSKAESQELYLVYEMPKETGCISIAAKKFNIRNVMTQNQGNEHQTVEIKSNFVKSHFTYSK